MSRTMEYYTEQAPLIREHLNAGASDFWELDTETENVLLEDYARALFGVFDFRASREQMEKLRALRSGWAYNVDKYGLYYAVLGGYYVTAYNSIFKSQIEDEEQLTPIGRQIKKEIDRSDGDPVLLLYHIK